MKKIVAIDQGEHLGGAEIFLSEVLRGLAGAEKPADRGAYDVHLLTSGAGKYLELYERSGVKVHQVALPRLNPFSISALLRFRRAAAALAAELGAIKPDLVISNTVRTHVLCSAAASRLRIPLIWFAHDLTFPRVLLRRFIRFPKTIICCSDFVRDYYSSALPRRTSTSKVGATSKVEVVHPFAVTPQEVAALAAIAPNKHDPAKPRVVGMVGNFIPWKGQDIFISMALAVHKQHPGTRFEIIGRTYEGNPESAKFRAKCEKLAAPLLTKKALTIRESVPSAIEEMAKWQILVHCSKEPEPLGRVILEGMAAGCAVIASNLGGPREVVNTSKNAQEGDSASVKDPDGLLVSPNTKTLTEAVSSLLDDPAMMLTLAKSAREKILRDYSQEKMHAKIADIIMKTF